MGAYIYKTTTRAVARITYRDKDGQIVEADANVYEYAYKPSGCWDNFNEHMEKRLIDPARRAFAKADKKPHELLIMAHEGKIELGSVVYRSRGHIAINDIGLGDYYPRAGTLLSVKRKGPGLAVDGLKIRLDSGAHQRQQIGCVYGTFHFDLWKECGWYHMQVIKPGDKVEHHMLSSDSDNERLLAHWTGFKDNAMRGPKANAA